MFSSLHVRNYRLYFIGQTVSEIGNWMQNVALAWLVFQLGGRGVALGLVTGARFAPLLVIGPWGGLVVDRFDKRRLLYVTESLAGLFSGVLALATALSATRMWMVFVIAAILGCVNVFDSPARQSILNDMVAVEKLRNAVTLNSVTGNVARVIGPAVAGLLIAGLGTAACFAVNSLSFGAVLLSLFLIDATALRTSTVVTRAPKQLREGFRYVLDTPQLLVPLVVALFVGTFAWEFPVTVPLIVSSTFHGNASTYGIVLSVVGLGAIVGGLLIGRRAKLEPSGIGWSAIFWGATIVAAALAPNIFFECVAQFFVGFGTIWFNSLSKASLQLGATPEMRGRVIALWNVAWEGTTPIGGPLVGWIAQAYGARWSLLAGGLPTVLVGIVFLPALRRMPVRVEGALPDDDPVAP